MAERTDVELLTKLLKEDPEVLANNQAFFVVNGGGVHDRLVDELADEELELLKVA